MKFWVKIMTGFLSILAICLPLQSLAENIDLQDVPYQFDATKVKASEDSFHFLRSFVDLFYLTYKANENRLQIISNLASVNGWCVGDAHAENFGVLLQQDASALFTMNDMDDSGPCPVALDLYRLMVSSRLYDPNTDLDKIIEAYTQGLKNKKFDMPSSISDLLKKGAKSGFVASDKKIKDGKIIRDPQMIEVTTSEKSQILKAIQAYGSALSSKVQVLDMVSTSKIGGGSGGLLRYEVLLNNNGEILQLEFKEEVKPSIYPVATSIPKTGQRISETIAMAQGPKASKLYTVVQINKKDMMIRPRFSGNVGVTLDDSSKSENKDIIRFEAYTLGLIHSHSVKDSDGLAKLINSISSKSWENDVDLMANYFDRKYKQAKQN